MAGIRWNTVLRVVVTGILALKVVSAVAQPRPEARVEGQGVEVTLDAVYHVPPIARGHVTLYRFELAPSAFTVRHRHGGMALFHVITGTVRTEIDNGLPRTFRAGETFLEQPWDQIMLLENDSSTAPATLLCVFLGSSHAH